MTVLVKAKDIAPSLPGVYMMLNKKGDIVYIGKALNLKSRVRSYFNVNSWRNRPKLSFMMPKVCEVKTIVTRSEKEALILEANLVHKYQPKYNVTLKDDKKFPWLMITYDEKYPRLVPIRDVAGFKTKYPKTQNKFFGPYSDSGAMWETYRILKEGFQLRLRKTPLFKDRPCMNYHIGLCSGPCQKLVSYEEYHKMVKQVEDFLLGRYKIVLKDLKKEMTNASKKLQYEKAKKLRDTIHKIEKVLEKQVVVSDNPNLSQDVFACSYERESMVLQLFLIREGKIIASESITLALPRGTNPQEAFSEGIKQYYVRVNDENIPQEIIVQFEINEKDYIENWLSCRLKKKVVITKPSKGKKLELVKMAKHNAGFALQKVLLTVVNGSCEAPLEELYKKLNLKNIPHHIECFDISHLSGTNTVGSMVCFIDGKPDKSKYRKFNLRTVVNRIDDFQAIKEIVLRRYSQVRLPDLIIIDGGKGQLSAAKEALERTCADFSQFDLISLAKRLEEVFKMGIKKSILLRRNSPALYLLERIRDEAHRFAISFQRDKRCLILKS